MAKYTHKQQIHYLHYATSIADISISKDDLSLIIRLYDKVMKKGEKVNMKEIIKEKQKPFYSIEK